MRLVKRREPNPHSRAVSSVSGSPHTEAGGLTKEHVNRPLGAILPQRTPENHIPRSLGPRQASVSLTKGNYDVLYNLAAPINVKYVPIHPITWRSKCLISIVGKQNKTTSPVPRPKTCSNHLVR